MSKQRYHILKLLGKGRTGGVYEAEDSRLGRKVAMRRFFSQDEDIDVAEYEDTFKEIAQSLGVLQHPNLLRVFDAGMDDDGAFIISQLMQGDSLHDRLKEGPISNWDVWDLSHQILDALATAHAAGFIHGAITPGSILMSPRARGGYLYVILDMGLSSLAPLIQGQDSVLSMMADPAILAPELFDGSEATEKSDLYMLGNILFMCLAGGHPFADQSFEECAELHSQGLPDLAEFAKDAPQELLDWIANLCEVDPELRPESAVAALETMPKVAKPVKEGVKSAATPPAPPTPPSGPPTANPLSYGNPEPALMQTGSITAGSTMVSQTTHGQLLDKYQSPAKSYKLLIITIIFIALLVTSLYFIMNGVGKKTGAEIAAERAQKEKEASERISDEIPSPNKPSEEEVDIKPADSNQFPLEDIILFNTGKGTPTSQGWQKNFKAHHIPNVNGWSISNAEEKNPGLGKALTAKNVEEMFERGWTIKYVVYAKEGNHNIGINISAEENKYWGDKGKPVSLILRLENVGDKLIIHRAKTQEKVEVKGGEISFLTIELRGKANDPTGSYTMFLNGKLVPDFKGSLMEGMDVDSLYQGQLYTSAGFYSTDNNSNWIIRELSLSTGTP